MRSSYLIPRTIEELHVERDNITPYWKVLAYLASWMLLAGFLLLPTTFDKQPDLRMSNGVVVIIIVTTLTAGHSLTALLWFACPSLLFRRDAIFIPAASCSLFGFLGTAWSLATCPRYDVSSPSAPISIAISLLSAATYSALGAFSHRRIQNITSARNYLQPSDQAPLWRDSSTGYHSQYDASSLHPLTAPSTHTRSHSGSIQYSTGVVPLLVTSPPPTQSQAPTPPAPIPLTEDEMVTQQMAALLTKPSTTSPNATAKQTFQLEWPVGEDEEDLRRASTFPMIGASQGIKTDVGVIGAFARIKGAMGLDRRKARGEAERLGNIKERREERRREIEMGSLAE